MKTIAYVLIVIAFLAASLISVLDTQEVNWAWLIPALAIGGVGVYFLKSTTRKAARQSDRLESNIKTMGASLASIVANLKELNASKDSIPTYDMRFDIDKRFRVDLNAFAEARESMIHVFGLQNYADIMSGFAAGERYINRVWSSSVDGYVDEVNEYLDRAEAQFIEAEQAFSKQVARLAASTQVA